MSELPEVLKFSDLSRGYDGVMYTNKVEPISHSTQTTKFQIPRQGILSSNGLIQFKYELGTLAGNADFACGAVGVGMSRGCLSRCTISTESGRILQDSRFFNKKSVVETSFRGTEYLRYIAPYLDGSNLYFGYTTPLEPVAVQGRNRLGGVPVNPDGTASPTASNWCPPKVVRMGGSAGTQVSQNWKLSLSEMFPLLSSTQIPVSLAEYLYIDLYWEADEVGNSVIVPSGTTYTATATSGVYEPQLIVDCLVYTDPAVMMAVEEKQMQGQGLVFPFEDTNVQVVSHVNSTAGGLEEEYDRMLGCNEYKLTCIKNCELTGLAGDANALLGKYYSQSQAKLRQLNFSLNDTLLYPTNTATNPINYERITDIYDHVDPSIPRNVYGSTSTMILSAIAGAGQVFMGIDQQSTLNGYLNVLGVNLKDSSNHYFQNGNAPVRVIYKKSATATQGTWAEDSLQYYFLNYLREFQLMPSGKFIVSAYA
jgi:hypothetical protein